jgi:hypothetical protein
LGILVDFAGGDHVDFVDVKATIMISERTLLHIQ